ncbi:carbon monoxide dehydrogenase [Chromatiales bacterium (ex Bugula neritina AB1)]|nr:carbon monoxide dehydrogenase [Chromatiales bacterium (ex Bugula neritina AB1)]
MRTTRFPTSASGVSERFSGFIEHLRSNGLAIGVAETTSALEALSLININNRNDVRLACKAICSSRADEFDQFDELFKAYWYNRGREKQAIAESHTPARKPSQSTFQPGVDSTRQAASSGESDEAENSGEHEHESAHTGDGKLIASTTTNLEKIDLRELMTPESLQRAGQLATRLAAAMRDRRSRRRRAANRGSLLDLRRIMRNSVSHGGEPLELFKRNKPDRPVNIVALLDVSGSMTIYARVFLSFLKGLVGNDQRTDAYLFHTKLVRVSDALRDHDSLRAVNRLSLMAQGFGGGTKIGTNLQRFNQHYAARTVSARSVVIIFSDGYDTDPPEVIASALARLKKRGCRIIWLNPLKGWKDYEPVARGMAAALPWLDLFAAANTLESLAALEPHLERL